MDIQFIDITSYRGISSNAEHYYAKLGRESYMQENLVTSSHCEANSGIYYEKELRYYPSYEEAEAMFEKDNHSMPGAFPSSYKKERIEEFMEDGTIRFPSIMSIVKKAKDDYPNSILCFSICGYRENFAKWVRGLNKEKFDEFVAIMGRLHKD